MPRLNGRINITVIDGKCQMETSIDPVMACQVLIRVLDNTFQQKVLQVEPNKLIWTPGE